ncbi:MAG TPA: iron-containing alcohol dehydrogenase [Thermoanaerobaculia bacterium]|jgi:alcohol dehydrogenase|nr:iron-containing alcohol dehydrogenase [Thermoanaerobaculia bacterium]
MTDPRPFRVPTRVVMAPGCLFRLPEVIAGFAPKRVLMVTDPGIEGTGWPERIWKALAEREIEAITFDDVEPNPRCSTVDRLASWGREEGVSLVLGIGGGSVLDAAKAAAMLIPNSGSAVQYEGRNRYEHEPLPFLAVPTTCGTGSEVTWVSVLTDEERQAKISVKGETMYPAWALVDCELLRTLPGHLVAWTGADALTHAVEAFTCRLANPISDALASTAVSLLLRYLRRAAADVAGDAEAREAVMRASTLAGLAFGNADVAAVHCLSETLGGRWDVPHGLANAVLLAPVTRFNLPASARKLAHLESALPPGSRSGAEGVLQAIEELVRDLGIPAFRELGISSEDYPWIAGRAVQNGSNPSNAREMGVEEYLEVLGGL